ncbi:uncharacterized protein SPPG_02805 [Spizellomyces punctatus DAOM BR117]|uniref:NADP-dependent oxidoreductase domain-containing protein n=1 Tax=Spizellomyces punctatus (strain DAOM BR117) TaxID=645134 RepID=A0A0L0HMK4_SPIPD|nr:uncharacterized protein SPPG_02805 [Spizellomyces punctatus DAOM BR117]KND02332.1 hypothetical protein SPPG_02805 [Spizellomyces punctatus DAOM BR117]|eukprot:XP_016610371.1 hypothetical protein SPPG_02805 [Spizellomyces punctatus DAOM BR117]
MLFRFTVRSASKPLALLGRGLHAGRATVEGTKRYAEQFASLAYSNVPKTGWTVSASGFGGYRIRKDVEEHENALSLALESGINVIDTSSHFENGSSEELIGRVLDKRINEELLERESVVIVTKAGYITSANFPNYLDVDHTVVADRTAHSLSPAFLEREITASLKRLGLETIDTFMLNNPERMMLAKDRPYSVHQVYDLIAKAATHLDKEVERGRIGSYGICSHSLPVRTAPDHLQLDSILTALARADVNLRNFVAIQYPFNLFERDAYTQWFDGSPSLMEIAHNNELFQFTHRPLYAIAGGQIRVLSTALGVAVEDEPGIMHDLTKAFEAVSGLEVVLPEMLGGTPEDTALVAKFVWGQVLSDNLSRLAQNLFAAKYYLKRQVQPGLVADLQTLRNSVRDAHNEEEVVEWARQYGENFQTLSETFLRLCAVSLLRSNEDLAKLLAALAPGRIKAESSLASTAAHVARSALWVSNVAGADPAEGLEKSGGCVLVGMRKPSYVEDIIDGMMRKDQILGEEQIESIFKCPVLA